MDQLVEKQNQDGINIQGLISNYKKAPLDRRTLEFHQGKLVELDNLWEAFNRRDNIIRQNYGDQEHQYFAKRYFDQIAAVCNEARENMQKNIKQGQQKSGEPQRATTSLEAAASKTYQEDGTPEHGAQEQYIFQEQRAEHRATKKQFATAPIKIVYQ